MPFSRRAFVVKDVRRTVCGCLWNTENASGYRAWYDMRALALNVGFSAAPWERQAAGAHRDFATGTGTGPVARSAELPGSVTMPSSLRTM